MIAHIGGVFSAVLQSKNGISAFRLDIGGEGVGLTGSYIKTLSQCCHIVLCAADQLQRVIAAIFFGGGAAGGQGGVVGAPIVGAFKVAVDQAVAYGILQFGGYLQLIALAGITGAILGKLSILGVALVILNADRIAHVVKLQDLHIVVMIRQGGLIVYIGPYKCVIRNCSINWDLYCRWTRERQKPGTEIFPFPAGCYLGSILSVREETREPSPCPLIRCSYASPSCIRKQLILPFLIGSLGVVVIHAVVHRKLLVSIVSLSYFYL